MSPPGGAPRRVPVGRVGIVWLVLGTILIVRSLSGIVEYRFHDPDDMLRLVQVRDLLAGQAWFDLHQYRIDGPDGTLMHWSRLVDIPLASTVGLFAPLIGHAAAEQVAIVGIPLLTLALVLLTVAWTASRWLDREGTTLACLCIGLSPVLMAQVAPLRIDHHGWQILAAVLAIGGLSLGIRSRGAVLAGVALAFGLAISIEVIPIVAAFGAVFALRWLRDGVTRTPLVAFLVTLAAASTALFLGTRGFVDLAQHCDVVAPAHLGFFAILAAGASGVALVRPRSRLLLMCLLAAPVAIALGSYLWMAPECASGPFAGMDPLVREFWYENVSEGRPIWRLNPTLWGPIVAHGLVALSALAYLSWRSAGSERLWWLEYLLVFAVTLATGLLVWRSLAFVGALSAIPLGWLAGHMFKAFRAAEKPWHKIAIAVSLMLALAPGLPVLAATAAFPQKPDDEEQASKAAECRLAGSMEPLNGLDPAKLFAPLDLGPALLLQTRHSVAATGHHRATKAMSGVVGAFLGSPDEAYRIVQDSGAQYVVICAELPEVQLYRDENPEGFASMLIANEAFDWLEPVAIELPPLFKVWRVKPEPPDGGK